MESMKHGVAILLFIRLCTYTAIYTIGREIETRKFMTHFVISFSLNYPYFSNYIFFNYQRFLENFKTYRFQVCIVHCEKVGENGTLFVNGFSAGDVFARPYSVSAFENIIRHFVQNENGPIRKVRFRCASLALHTHRQLNPEPSFIRLIL